MKYQWMKELSREGNNEEFSDIVHQYYKLATMRVMQFLRKKYDIPADEIPTVTLAVFARFLNESCYSLGANIRSDYKITDFYSKQQLLTLVRVLNGEPLKQEDRDDIDWDIKSSLDKFKRFILDNASDFCVGKN
jgi:hypothetical protein